MKPAISTQDSAQTFCYVVRARLAEIDSQEDDDRALLAAQTAPDQTRFWIGLSDATSEGRFTWKNGRALRYSNWADGEHNGGTRENCVELRSTSGEWNDVQCSANRAHICQRDIKSKYITSIWSRMTNSAHTKRWKQWCCLKNVKSLPKVLHLQHF